MSQSGLTWGYGEVVSIENCFKQETNNPKKQETTPEGKGTGKALGNSRMEIEVMLQGNMTGAGNKTAGTTILAYPADLSIVHAPLVGEHVVCFQSTGPEAGPNPADSKTGEPPAGNTFDLEWFYLSPLPIQGNVHLNANPGAAAGGVKSNKTIQDGEKKDKSEAYANAETGNPNVANKKPQGPSGADNNLKNPETTDELSDKMISKFQKLEQSALDYKAQLDAGDNRKDDAGFQERLDKITEYKDELTERGYTGEFAETTGKFGGIETITGYLELSALTEKNYSTVINVSGDPALDKTPGGIKSLKPEELGYGEAFERAQKGEDPRGNPDPPLDKDTSNNHKTQNTIDTKPGQDFVEKENLNNLQPYEGDILIQGRHGQSFRFGSTIVANDPDQYYVQPSYEEGMAGVQAPINIIRAGQSTVQQNSENNYIIEDINGDKASVYMCSGQKIAINLASISYEAIAEPMTGGENASVTDSNGNVIPSFACSSVSTNIEPPPEMDPLPSNVEELELLDGVYEYFNTDRKKPNYAKVVGTDRIRLIQGSPVLEQLCPLVLRLFKEAKKQGIRMKLNSAFRGLWQINHPKTGKKLASGQVNCRYSCAINKGWSSKANMEDRSSPLWTARSTKFSPYVAIPGTSRHQSGTAIDLDYKRYKIDSNGKQQKTKTTDHDGVYAWLVANSYKYGFVRTVTTEEWHHEYNLDYAAKGPFGKLRPGSGNSWHGQDNLYNKGAQGPWG